MAEACVMGAHARLQEQSFELNALRSVITRNSVASRVSVSHGRA